MENTIKKNFLLLVLTLIITGGVFAQRVGDTVQLGGQTYRVESVSGDRVVLHLVSLLDGVWNEVGGWTRVITISGNTGVFTHFNSNAFMLDAESKGYIKIGDQYLRNLTKTGDLTWSCQEYGLTTSGSNAT